jgi:hypothetical protein
MLRLVIRVVVILIVLLLGVVMTRPATFHVERSIGIEAPAAAAYEPVADFHRWTEWSPWEKLDPAMSRTVEGVGGAVGSTYHWSGNDKVGEGRMTVLEAEPGDHVTIRLEFLKPFASTSITRFTFAPEPGGTRVTWNMDGNNDLMAKAMSLFASMDKMVGPDFERGLANLKTVAESAPVATPADSAAAVTP